MYGLQVYSDSAGLIVSDELKIPHFMGKATLVSSTAGITNFPYYGSSYDNIGGYITHKYVISSSIAPMVFIRPGSTTYSYGTLKTYYSGGSWYIDIVQLGTNSVPPQIYCFSTLDNTGFQATSSTYGLQVFNSQGDITFDSRYIPLVVEGVISVNPPSDPTDGNGLPGVSYYYPFRYATLDHAFTPYYNKNTYVTPTNNITDTDIMYSVPTIGQSVQRRGINGYKKSCAAFGDPQYHYSYAQWWVLYRNVFSVGGNTITASWLAYQAAYQYWERITKSGGFLGVGGGSGDSSYIVGNTLPYSPKTININPVTMIVTNASRYDI